MSRDGAEETPEQSQKRMWGGRFEEATDELVQRFNASIDVDRELALEDIEGSVAHATMLAEREILSPEEASEITEGLREIEAEIRAGDFEWRVELEDVHMNIERALTERIGSLGGKLHTARSRNDQVATDFRLWLKRKNLELQGRLTDVRTVLVELADANLDVILPGYTHLQVAQPLRFSHHLLAYFEMFGRDRDRLIDGLRRIDVSPLGAGALAGTGFPIDRHRTAELLGFGSVAANSLDAVSDRDFAIEFLSTAATTMMHLSRLSEELIIWSSQEFGFITLPDSHTTGSSIMPQKKNPDVSELIRGKTGRVYGSLLGLLTTMKGLPLAYNKDMQEDKEGVIDTALTLDTCLRLTATMLPRIRVNRERMAQAAGAGFSNATDLADYLARKGLPFRQAHEVVGKLVAKALEQDLTLQELPMETMKEASEAIDEDVYPALGLEQVVDARNSYGGTSRRRVEEQLSVARAALDEEQR